jgi:hypothetical protein
MTIYGKKCSFLLLLPLWLFSVLQRLHAPCLLKSAKYQLAMGRQPYAISNSFVWQAPVKQPPPPARSEIRLPHTHVVISQRHYASRNTRVICYIRRPVARGFVSPLGCMSHVTKLLWRAAAWSTSVGRQNWINPAQSGVISVAVRLISTELPYVWVPYSTCTLWSF